MSIKKSKLKTIKALGEFGLISHLTKNFPKYSKNIKVGIGDDAAVIIPSKNDQLVITTDTLVENDHFNCNWSTPFQIGKKAIEINVSDIAAMGAEPTYVLVSIVITTKTDITWLSQVYRGIKQVCQKYKISLIGGDTTKGSIHMISVTMLGAANKPCLRSGAKVGDLICVSGQIGGSAAGYFGLKSGKKLAPYIKKRHLEPVARLDVSCKIAKFINAIIDISDGAGSEVKHIAKASQKGAIIYANRLPMHKDVLTMEKKLGLTKYYCALSGGEDFELLFTISKSNYKKISKLFKKDEISVIGEITANSNQLDLVLEDGSKKEIPGGWDHTRS